MKLRVYLLSALTLLGCPLSASAQESGASTNTVSGAPWTSNRALGEGAGIRTGNVEWHPGVSAQFGFDSNYLQRSSSTAEEATFGPVVPSLRLRITPQLSVRTADRSAESGKDVRKVPKPLVMFDVTAAASYNEFVALRSGFGSQFSDLRNLQGGVGAGLSILPSRPWSGKLNAAYSYVAEPSNAGGNTSEFDRHSISGGAGLVWAPGGGTFRWTIADYSARVTLFNRSEFGVYDNANHMIRSHGMWRFLPKTAVLYDGQYELIRYSDDRRNDGDAMQARLGLNGLLTRKLAVLAMGGWANSFYDNQIGLVRNYSGFVAKAEVKWFFTPDGKLKEGDADVGASALAAGFLRDYNNSYLGDFYRRNRGYAQMSYLIGGSVVTTAEAGVSLIEYPDYLVEEATVSGFNETRVDVQGLVEYRPAPSLGINLTLRYDQNISRTITATTFQDDLSFSRFRGMLGVRWFL